MTKILYLEGRPSAHVLHRRLAKAVADKIDYIDPKIQWQDKDKSFFGNLYAWIKNASYLRKYYKHYDIFLVDNLHFTPVIMNLLFPVNRKTLVLHLGSHTLYFMHAKKFSKINTWLHKKMLAQYDYLLCEGEMAKDFVHDLLGVKMPATYTTFLGPPAERFPVLNAIAPALNSFKIIIIANGPAVFRMHYKGLDIMIEAFEKAANSMSALELQVIGEWTPDLIELMLANSSTEVKTKIKFLGKVNSIEDYLRNAGLCLPCSRGDAFPTATLEALAAGVPAMVSDLTGTKEVVAQVDPKLIVPLDAEMISNRILWYFKLPSEKRNLLSEKCREIVSGYTEERAIENYKVVFSRICDHK